MSGIYTIARAALDFAHATADVRRCQQDLRDGYRAWRQHTRTCYEFERDSAEWTAMMAATALQHRRLENAKGRERRAKNKLLRVAGEVQ